MINIKNKSHSVTAEIDVPDGGAERRDHRPGRRVRRLEPLPAKDGKPKYCYNLLGLQRFNVEGDAPVPAGTHQVRDGVRLRRRRPRQGRRRHAVRRRRPRSARAASRPPVPMIFSADETADLGADTGITGQRRLHRRGRAASPARSTGCSSTCGEAARRPRPPDHARGTPPRRDGAAVARVGHGADLGVPEDPVTIP